MTSMLGSMLVERGAVTEEALETALTEQRETRERLGAILVRRGLEPEALARTLAAQLRLEHAAAPLRPENGVLDLVPRTLALRLRVLPLAANGRSIRIAMADPLDANAIDDLQFRTGRRVEPSVATEEAIERGLLAAYGEEAVRAVLRRLDPQRGSSPPSAPMDGPDVAVLRQASEAPPIVALVDLILDRAAAAGSSDIHIEPAAGSLRVRARIDGVLRPILDLPAQASAAVVSRIKIMAGLDIAVKRRPQDGRSAITRGTERIALRVSTLPAQDGEKIVLRLLDPRTARRSLDTLGMEAELRASLEAVLGRQHGMFLVTGPTGSGKTTTLYALLESLDREGRNILTLEDPVEYRLDGLTQVQVQPRAGLTFAAALRAVLRQDPDVVMVGEMRDRETAEVGLAAALTGHLVLSTLHTIDAAGAVARLVEMGAPRYLVAGGLIGVLAQRLVRSLCASCRGLEPASAPELAELGLPIPPHLPRAVGCERCAGSGYRGRVGVYELLRVGPPVRELILDGSPVDAIREAAAAGGTQPLGVDAWRKVESGRTTLDEVRPFIRLLSDEARRCRSCGAGVARGQTVCPLCGGSLARRCDCGAEVRAHWRFCGGCGRRLEPLQRADADESWNRGGAGA